MQKGTITAALILATTLPLFAAKTEGNTTLKDLQPAGTPDKDSKKNKHQSYDLSFVATGKQYTCRTDPQKSINATAFVVGTDMKYQLDGDKAKIKTSEGKQLECKVVRVEAIPAP
jgi:hypothetical protein